jgi:hypothetical protein
MYGLIMYGCTLIVHSKQSFYLSQHFIKINEPLARFVNNTMKKIALNLAHRTQVYRKPIASAMRAYLALDLAQNF